jgi:glutamate-1-semialdehyde-2,1-aminomutase
MLAPAPRSLRRSQAWRERAEKVIPGGAQTFSKSPLLFVQGVAPNFVDRAAGAEVWDVDGNRYIDYILGLGPIVLGHCHPAVDAAVREQMGRGMSFSLPHPIEVELAERIASLVPCAEMVRYGKNGSDVTAAAVRVSRAFTGRDKVACCGYHGWQDWYIGSTSRRAGVPEAVRALTLPFPYNDLDALDRLFRAHPDQIACVIMEPVAFTPPEDGYLAGVRDLCRRHGALLVFDEVVTGFRLALGGAQAHFGVLPDLACFGKGLANGYPLSAIAGRADVMRGFNEVFFSFTHGGEVLSLAAGLATLAEAQAKDLPGHLWRVGTRLQAETNRLVAACGLEHQVACVGLPPWTAIRFTDAAGKDSMLLRSLFQQEAVKRGVLTHGNHMLSLSHTDAIVDATMAAYAEVFAVLAQAVHEGKVAERLEGPPMQPVIRPV